MGFDPMDTMDTRLASDGGKWYNGRQFGVMCLVTQENRNAKGLRRMNRKLLFLSALLAGGGVQGANVTGVWTGAEDVYWTNANNRVNGVMPGRVIAANG